MCGLAFAPACFWPLGTGSAEGKILRGLRAAWSRGRSKKTGSGAGRGRGNIKGCSLAREEEPPDTLGTDIRGPPAASDALKIRLLPALAVLGASLLPTRETKPLTADVITASGSKRPGTHKQGLSGAAAGPGSPEQKAFLDGSAVETGGWGGREFWKQSTRSSDYLSYFTKRCS